MDLNTMKRVEFKYILNKEQTILLQDRLKGYMETDKYGMTSIASLYFDTNNYRLIRQSIEKPIFKEKIRLRSYGLAKDNSPVFLEIKRKTYDIVYKRRIKTTQEDVYKFFNFENQLNDDIISKEICYFRNYYKNLRPSCLIIYERVAYFEPCGDLRLTIDFNPRYRLDNLNLNTSLDGNLLLDEGSSILEIKVQDAIPSWLSKILSDLKIYKSSFSKYGEAYKRNIVGGDIYV